MFLGAPEHENPNWSTRFIFKARADDSKWVLKDNNVDSMRIWFSRVYVLDWRKLERVFQAFHKKIKDEAPVEYDIIKN